MRRRLAAVLVAAVVAVSACGGDDESGSSPGYSNRDDSASTTYEFTIPAGAGEALDAGTPLEILPGELIVEVGETIRIVNEDERGHNVGPWFVGANDIVSQEFTRSGTFEGVCTVHPSGQLVLVVNEG